MGSREPTPEEGLEAASTSTRVYVREWEAPQWRGSLQELVSAARDAREELAQRDSGAAVAQNLTLNYSDGSSQTFTSIEELESSPSPIDIASVVGFAFSFGEDNPGFSIWGTEWGLRVKAYGSEAFAEGIVGSLKNRLKGGVDAAAQAVSVRPSRSEWGALALGSLAAITLLTVNIIIGDRGDLLGWLGILLPPVLLGGSIPLGWALFYEEFIREEPRGITLVPEGQQFPSTPSGPSWVIKEWFDGHPAAKWLVSLLVGFAVGVLTNQVS